MPSLHSFLFCLFLKLVDHKIAFSRVQGSDLFDITWEGKIALTYVGNFEPKHCLLAEINGVPFPKLTDGSL